MKHFFCIISAALFLHPLAAQTPATYHSSDLLMQLRKLNQLGSVLYIAAHPDDENTRLLAYLANEKQYRTGYLSLTRGDGGQNLIGDEQGIDLGLIRTQELLAARRIDGAEQFFTRAYDFGFCKSPEEALQTWGHEKILSDVVRVVRRFRPDVIIARFPEDARAGHGHHAASGILAREAFDAAADPTRFPEQLEQGLTVWQAKRMLWNTYNFGSGTDTRNESQFKTEVGMHNPLLGRSYGEIAALSRSQHKSQGFGVPAQRGSFYEYFETIRGDRPQAGLLDGVETGWQRIRFRDSSTATRLRSSVDTLVSGFRHEDPAASVPLLLRLRKTLLLALREQRSTSTLPGSQYYLLRIKLEETDQLILRCSGLFAEATAASQLNTIGDSLRINVTVNNRLGAPVDKVEALCMNQSVSFSRPAYNQNNSAMLSARIDPATPIPQPYWLEYEKAPGAFTVKDPSLIGLPQQYAHTVFFRVYLQGDTLELSQPVLYKYTDPIRGELYQPLQLVDPLLISSRPSLLVLRNSGGPSEKTITFTLQANQAIRDTLRFRVDFDGQSRILFDSLVNLQKGEKREIRFTLQRSEVPANSSAYLSATVSGRTLYRTQYFALARISYEHIPDLFYHYIDGVKVVRFDLHTAGTRVGYIPGAGDKIPQALEQMGYEVSILKEADILSGNLQQFDAVVTGIRAYNTNDWMAAVYPALMRYVEQGGVLVTQYNTQNFISSLKSRIGPWHFSISRNRVTDEKAPVELLDPAHPVFNYPNRITERDFDGWVQERSVYHAEKADSAYRRLIRMNDAGEQPDEGSLLVADYGRGRFVYTGLVFFRQLPAGVPGAYRLWANLLAPRQPQSKK